MSSLTSGDSPSPNIGLSMLPVGSNSNTGLEQSQRRGLLWWRPLDSSGWWAALYDWVSAFSSPAGETCSSWTSPTTSPHSWQITPPAAASPVSGSVVSVISRVIILISANIGLEYQPLGGELDRFYLPTFQIRHISTETHLVFSTIDKLYFCLSSLPLDLVMEHIIWWAQYSVLW